MPIDVMHLYIKPRDDVMYDVIRIKIQHSLNILKRNNSQDIYLYNKIADIQYYLYRKPNR